MAQEGGGALFRALGLFSSVKGGDAGLQGGGGRFRFMVCLPISCPGIGPAGTAGAETLPGPQHMQGLGGQTRLPSSPSNPIPLLWFSGAGFPTLRSSCPSRQDVVDSWTQFCPRGPSYSYVPGWGEESRDMEREEPPAPTACD